MEVYEYYINLYGGFLNVCWLIIDIFFRGNEECFSGFDGERHINFNYCINVLYERGDIE